MKIITSIYIYNFHLFVSTLKDGLMIMPFGDNRKRFYNSNISYSRVIESEKTISELQGINHVLYGSKDNKLTAIDLVSHHKSKYFDQSNQISQLNDITQISLDSIERSLYALSDNKGIFKINTNNFFKENIEQSFIPKIFDKIGNPVIANIEAKNRNIFLAIRNYGVSVLDSQNSIILERKEIRTSDPQDVKRIGNLNYLAIADSEDGIIIYDLEKNEFYKKIKLPNNDFPQQIEIVFGVVIIKGTFGLYAYHIKMNKLEVLREGKIGTFAVYYDYIFFSNKGKIFALTLNNGFERHKFTISRDIFDVEILRKLSGS